MNRNSTADADAGRACPLCGERFMPARSDAIYCSNGCRQAAYRARLCSIAGCSKRRFARGWCKVYYTRWLRHGDPLTVLTGLTWITSGGYAKRGGSAAHPLADGNGAVYVHRAVLYDRIGIGPHACWWCDTPVEWTAWTFGQPTDGVLVADHLDGDRLNNNPDNLVPSCVRCNQHRPRQEAPVTDSRPLDALDQVVRPRTLAAS